MKAATARAIDQVTALSPIELEVVGTRATALRVGGSKWEEAWLAANSGHAAGLIAQQRAIAMGASAIAAAAIAGAVAAFEAAEDISPEQQRTLVAPACLIDLPDPTGPIGRWRPLASVAA